MLSILSRICLSRNFFVTRNKKIDPRQQATGDRVVVQWRTVVVSDSGAECSDAGCAEKRRVRGQEHVGLAHHWDSPDRSLGKPGRLLNYTS